MMLLRYAPARAMVVAPCYAEGMRPWGKGFNSWNPSLLTSSHRVHGAEVRGTLQD